MTPGVHNIEIKQGSSMFEQLNWAAGGDDVDLTGYAARLVVRYKATSATIILDCSTSNGRITLGGSPNIVIEVSKTVTQELAPGDYVYDLEMTSASGRDYPLLTGRFSVKANAVPAT